MWSSFIKTCHQQTNAVRSLSCHLGVPLGTISYLVDDAFNRDRATIGHLRGEGLLFHEIGEDAGIGGKTSES